ncbi:histidine phosphatase family protein [candidate division CSSED10-310 bacterium]|uniref:Histidine phosphatase family protein n=1 Tax=candidate division CSSED10-310 bacterium TaxID=2855610 RepID=A0ABV6Z390_UNCC1
MNTKIKIPKTHIYLIRHGHTIWNDEDRMRGRIDVELSPAGLKQAQATRDVMHHIPLDRIYAGPLQRTMVTAQEIAQPHNLTPVPSLGFHDFDFGEWQGLLRTEIRERWAELYHIYDQHPQDFQAPGGETLPILQQRVFQELNRLVLENQGRIIAVVSHSVTLQIVILALLGLGVELYWNLCQDQCCINEITHGSRGYTIVRLNDTGHLATLRE